jgi:hypothetical protein
MAFFFPFLLPAPALEKIRRWVREERGRTWERRLSLGAGGREEKEVTTPLRLT